MIPDSRARQPRDGPMKCGTQPANISMIHRRYKLRASRSRSGVRSNPTSLNVRRGSARNALAPIDTKGPYQLTIGLSYNYRQSRRSPPEVIGLELRSAKFRCSIPAVDHRRIGSKPGSSPADANGPVSRPNSTSILTVQCNGRSQIKWLHQPNLLPPQNCGFVSPQFGGLLLVRRQSKGRHENDTHPS
jgi:hypothetical protein